MSTSKVLICMADNGQDPTEAAIPWTVFRQEGFTVEFATEHGSIAAADPKLLEKSLFGKLLGAKPDAVDAYRKMKDSTEFNLPHAWGADGFDILQYDAVILPGGHDKPMRQYMESPSLHRLLALYLPHTSRTASPLNSGTGQSAIPAKVVGAICHGVLALAFAKTEEGQSLLGGFESTTLPRWMEAAAWMGSQAWALGSYYRTYGAGRWCSDDVVNSGAQYICGPMSTSPFVHVDPAYRYVSARFPGDAALFAQTVVTEIKSAGSSS